MTNWNMTREGIYTQSFARGALTAPGASNTKGAWLELVSSTSFNTNFVLMGFSTHYYSQRKYLVDLGVGGSGSEEVFVADMGTSNGSPSYIRQYLMTFFAMPLHIPKNTRIAGRYQSNSTDYLWAQLNLFSSYAGFGRGLAGVDTHGEVTADSGGTSVDSGGVANTYGTWVEFVASTGKNYKGVILGQPWNGNAARATAAWKVQIGVGGLGSEEVLLDEYALACRDSDDDPSPRVSPFIPMSIPSGSRVSVRSKCGITDATDRLLDIILYLFY